MYAAAGTDVEKEIGTVIAPKCTQIQFGGFRQAIEKYGRHEETRTPDLYRVKVAL
jgi:hypothetical protein